MLWRHGRTSWNATGRMQGQLDPPLDELGVAQAAASAAALRSLAPAALVSSDLERARTTAQALADLLGMPLQLDERWREIHLGEWQGLTRDEAAERFPEQYAAWIAGRDVRRGGGETNLEVGQRAAAAAEELVDALPPGGVAVAVTHGGCARAAIGVLLELDPASWWRLAPLGNAHWATLVRTDRGWRLVAHNNVAQLAAEDADEAAAAPDVEPGERPLGS